MIKENKMTVAEVKTYLETNFSFESEEVLEETAKNLKRVLENTVYGGIAYNDNIYSLSQKKRIELNSSRSIVKE